jgi:tripartite-type tricarboxylate transporter receptor subunit TctC
MKDFAPVALLATGPSVLIVSASLPVYDLRWTAACFSAAAADETCAVGFCDPDATVGGDRSFVH